VNTLTSDLAIVLDSDANSPAGMLTLRKGPRMFPGRTLLLLGLGLSLCLTTLAATAGVVPRPAMDFPPPVDSYHDQQIPSIFEKTRAPDSARAAQSCCDCHFFLLRSFTRFLTAQFRKIAHRYQRRYDAVEELLPATASPPDSGKEHDKLIFRAQLFLFHGRSRSGFSGSG